MNRDADAAVLVDRIDALLPQTQCRRCGYAACRPYAEAMARDEAAIDRCPPGGSFTLEALSSLLGRSANGVDPACGTPGPRTVAVIDEAWCIGCTLCIQACPVDAIVGAAKRMHAVLESECTGCELCVAPCPVDCISMGEPRGGPASRESWMHGRAALARRRFEARERRLEGARRSRRARGFLARAGDAAARRAGVAEAVARVRSRRAADAPR